jgi:hypothetical protein
MATNNSINSQDPIQVSKGGLGVNSTTAFGILAGGTTSTGAIQNCGTGSAGQILTSNGASALPSFQAAPAGGITGPGSSTDRAISTWNGITGSALFDNSTTKIDSTGRFTNSAQPCFCAILSTTQSNVTGDGTPYTIIFDTERFDRGSNYNNTTGIFTAPVTGIYHFSAYALYQNMNSATQADIRIETTAKTFLFGNYAAPTLNAGQNWPIGFSLTVDMTAGDTAKIIANVGNSTKSVAVFGDTATPRTGFSGFLVC